MKIKQVLTASILFVALSFSSCSSRTYKSSAISGAVGGTVAGAATGAVVGSVIANGDIAASALLGAGIGLPVGAMSGIAYKYYVVDKPVRENNKKIQENYQAIVNRQTEIDELREKLLHDSFLIKPNENYRDYMYLGASVGRLR